MKIESNIKRTLKKKLFDNPRVINLKKYLKLKKVIFPGEEDFILFLEESNYEKVVKLARKIVFRLYYENCHSH